MGSSPLESTTVGKMAGSGQKRVVDFMFYGEEMEELISKVGKLKELEESFVHCLNKDNGDNNTLEQALKYILEWGSVKKQIRLGIFDKSVACIPGSKNRGARKIIQRINLDEKLPFECIFAGTALEKLFETELSDDEINSLESELFYSWFSGYDFVKELYGVGTLISSVGDIQNNLSMFIDELRLCYVFQRYLAVYALCRTMLEITMMDLYDKNNLNDLRSKNYRQVKKSITQAEEHLPPKKKFRFPIKDPTLYQTIKMLTAMDSYKHLVDALDDIREKTNPILHGNIDFNIPNPMEIMRTTLQSIHELYEIEVAI